MYVTLQMVIILSVRLVYEYFEARVEYHSTYVRSENVFVWCTYHSDIVTNSWLMADRY